MPMNSEIRPNPMRVVIYFVIPSMAPETPSAKISNTPAPSCPMFSGDPDTIRAVARRVTPRSI